MISQGFTAIVLAAGKGTRMRSPMPKVLHELAGRSMLFHVFKALHGAGATHIVCVVGHGRAEVEAEIKALSVEFGISAESVVQAEQRGTGHAVQVAFEASHKIKKEDKTAKSAGSVMIVNGDSLLLHVACLEQFIAAYEKSGAVLSLGAFTLANPTGYGRVVKKGQYVQRIVEEKEATVAEKKIGLVNGGLYLGKASFFQKFLSKLKPSKKTNEIYITDLVGMATKAKLRVAAISLSAQDLRGANDMAELAEAERIWQGRQLLEFMRRGIKIVDPNRVWIGADVQLADGVVIEPGVMILGKSDIGPGVVIEAGSRLENMRVLAGARIKAYCYLQDSVVGARASIGPFAHLRPGTVLGADTKIGNFVELKKSELGDGSKISHLSYVGDAVIGKDVNLGCGFITCNYDGFQKHVTKIEDGAFVGSDVQAIAPLTIGKDSYVASGTTLTRNVPAQALAIARVRQETKDGYAPRLKERLRRSKK